MSRCRYRFLHTPSSSKMLSMLEINSFDFKPTNHTVSAWVTDVASGIDPEKFRIIERIWVRNSASGMPRTGVSLCYVNP